MEPTASHTPVSMVFLSWSSWRVEGMLNPNCSSHVCWAASRFEILQIANLHSLCGVLLVHHHYYSHVSGLPTCRSSCGALRVHQQHYSHVSGSRIDANLQSPCGVPRVHHQHDSHVCWVASSGISSLDANLARHCVCITSIIRTFAWRNLKPIAASLQGAAFT